MNNDEDGGTRRKRRQLSSRNQLEPARLAIEIDSFLPTSVIYDRQFERIFQLTKAIMEHLIQICAKTDPFFTDIQDVKWLFLHCASGQGAYGIEASFHLHS
jgi:hypothetical protein